MYKNILIAMCTIAIIGIASANLQIQTNLEHAVQTIKKVFITSDGLANNPGNTLVSINDDNAGTVFIKNKLETEGSVVFQGLTNNNTPDSIVSIQPNGTLTKTAISALGTGGGTGSAEQRQETSTTLFTNKIVGINNIGLNHQFWVGGSSIFQSGSNIIYIYPNNQYSSSNGGLASRNNNLKINTKTGGTLYVNADITANTIIHGDVSIGTGHIPQAALDIDGKDGYSQIILRNDYAPYGYEDPNGETGAISRGYDDGKWYIYVKTTDGRRRAALEFF